MVDLWSIKPPDFSLRLYKGVSSPEERKKKKKSTRDDAIKSKPTEVKQKTEIFLPKLFAAYQERTEPPAFITSHKPPDAVQTELTFIRRGRYPLDPYRDPKPHDFRPLDEDLPDLVTTNERDPGNLKFKLRHLDTIRTIRWEPLVGLRDPKAGLLTHRPAEPRWEPELFLPKVPWPPRSASFTRHRRRRGVYSAFLDRVEEKLSGSWEKR